jgi:hypothetical protein
MTTVAQMIEWLKTLPQDAEVECGEEVISGYATYMTYSPVDIDCSYVFDYSGPRWKDSALAGKKIVQISAE